VDINKQAWEALWISTSKPLKPCGYQQASLGSLVDINKQAWEALWISTSKPGKPCGYQQASLGSLVDINKQAWEALWISTSESLSFTKSIQKKTRQLYSHRATEVLV